MADLAICFSGVSSVLWLITLLLPWRPWKVNEVLEADSSDDGLTDLSHVTVVIPARNEAEVIAVTLAALEKQGSNLHVILVDDESTDGTAEIATQSKLEHLQIIRSQPLPKGWTGKLWAQDQGVKLVDTDKILLLDADIELKPGMIKALLDKQKSSQVYFVSLMAVLRFGSFWEKLLMPAFIHFFKMIYPFALSNNPNSKIAAAAGGCIMLDSHILSEIGGMESIKDAVIDDCTLAKKVKSSGYTIWTGLTHGVVSLRPYVSLPEIWEMVARTAYTQLYYSVILLLGCTGIMLVMYWVPILGLLDFDGWSFVLSLFSLLLMVFIYSPILRFYSFHLVWSSALPIIAGLYLLMTWTSALRYWGGVRSKWKGRVYQKI